MSSESRGCPAAAIIGVGCVLALYFIVSLMITAGNQLGLLFRLVLAGAALLGIWRPKAGVVLLLLMCGYTDLMKRLLVLVDKITHEDLMYVLATPPVLVMSLTVGTLAKCLGGSLKFGPLQIKSLGLITLCAIATLLSSLGSYSSFSTMAQDLANGAAYSTFLLVIPLLFPDMGDQMKLLKTVLIGYLPVAAYGVYQAMFGLAYFEVEYLKTGLSILISQLTTGEVRPFSTLNSPTALGAMCGMFALLAFLSGPLRTRRRTLPGLSALLVGICYVAGMIASTSRSDLFIILAGGLMAVAARRRSRTFFVYGFGLVSYLILIFSAAWLQDRLANVQAVISYYLPTNSVFIDQLTRVQTFSDRLEGFRHLVSDSRIWTLFGASANVKETLTSHDPLTSALLAHGVIPVIVAIVFFIALLIRVHRSIWALRDSRLQWMAAVCLSTVWGLVATSMISGNRMSIFPVNVFMWLLLAMVWSAGAATASAPVAEPIEAVGPTGFALPPSRQRYPIRMMRRG